MKLSRFYYEFSVQIPTNNDLNRDNLILNLNPKNSFEKMLDRKLMNFLPISHLESFKKIETYLEKITYKPKIYLQLLGMLLMIYLKYGLLIMSKKMLNSLYVVMVVLLKI